MATSAQTLSTILELTMTLTREGKSNEAIMKTLAERELLPAKLLPKKSAKTSMFASRQAEEAASKGGLTDLEEGGGSGREGRYTLADVNKKLESPKKKKPTSISPSALQLANEKGISIASVRGSGKDGRIVLKDIEALIEEDEEAGLNISPRALNEAKDAHISEDKLKTLHGSGKDGRIILSDIEKLKSETENDSDDDDDDDSDED
jgi:pyruvate/2-oxoglutarate dehydrogenase complex dihydrolipoamide acyltransferase (E2) component